MLEILNYKTIPNFTNYKISECGYIYSLVAKKHISRYLNHAGYEVATITDDNGFRSPRKVHRLVYSAFVGSLIHGMVIDHKDNNRRNNHYKNLQQITPSENSRKTFISGNNKYRVVWTKETIHRICNMLENNYPEEKIFKELNIIDSYKKDSCIYLISSLIRGTMHKDITEKYNLKNYISSLNKKDRKLSIDDVREIYVRALFDDISILSLSKIFSVTTSTIDKIRYKKTWNAVTDKIDNELGIYRVDERSTTIPWVIYNINNLQEYGSSKWSG